MAKPADVGGQVQAGCTAVRAEGAVPGDVRAATVDDDEKQGAKAAGVGGEVEVGYTVAREVVGVGGAVGRPENVTAADPIATHCCAAALGCWALATDSCRAQLAHVVVCARMDWLSAVSGRVPKGLNCELSNPEVCR